MSTKAAEYVTQLSQDPKAMEEFAKDPHASMEGHDLSDEDREVLASGDTERIRTHLGEEGPPGCLVILVPPGV